MILNRNFLWMGLTFALALPPVGLLAASPTTVAR